MLQISILDLPTHTAFRGSKGLLQMSRFPADYQFMRCQIAHCVLKVHILYNHPVPEWFAQSVAIPVHWPLLAQVALTCCSLGWGWTWRPCPQQVWLNSMYWQYSSGQQSVCSTCTAVRVQSFGWTKFNKDLSWEHKRASTDSSYLSSCFQKLYFHKNKKKMAYSQNVIHLQPQCVGSVICHEILWDSQSHWPFWSFVASSSKI